LPSSGCCSPIQRPENHALHHERGVHAYDYGDIALWDMVFGTFKDPETWNGVGGFYDGASRRLPEMLTGIEPPDALAA
jgi:sterol desaturase/sphingolipid hydroxylase (fatty acid hydroxylase superfamily)